MSAEILKDGEVMVDFGKDRQALSEYLNRYIPWGTAEYPVRYDDTVRITMGSWDTLDYIIFSWFKRIYVNCNLHTLAGSGFAATDLPLFDPKWICSNPT